MHARRAGRSTRVSTRVSERTSRLGRGSARGAFQPAGQERGAGQRRRRRRRNTGPRGRQIQPGSRQTGRGTAGGTGTAVVICQRRPVRCMISNRCRVGMRCSPMVMGLCSVREVAGVVPMRHIGMGDRRPLVSRPAEGHRCRRISLEREGKRQQADDQEPQDNGHGRSLTMNPHPRPCHGGKVKHALARPVHGEHQPADFIRTDVRPGALEAVVHVRNA